MGLRLFRKKRDFQQTPEPSGGKEKSSEKLTFVIQRHNASQLHYDFRLEMNGVLKSWAVPKGPSMNPGERRLAIQVEDHPLAYGKFYGEIPEGNYGAGIVEIWDSGTYEPLEPEKRKSSGKQLLRQFHKGELKFVLKGKHLNGAFALVRMDDGTGKNWLLIKKSDEYAVTNYDITSIDPVMPFRKKKPVSAKSRASSAAKAKEKETKTGQEQELRVNGKKLTITHPGKVYFPAGKITKGDLIEYYLKISPFILPYLKNRPESLHRHPNGITKPGFYHKNMDLDQIPKWLHTEKEYSKSTEEYVNYLICNNPATLVYMANLGCIEMNPWNSTFDKPDHPDYLIMDLDPGKIAFREVVRTAMKIREVCRDIGIETFCKTSGASGLHVFIPLKKRYSYEEIQPFCETLARVVHQQLPDTTSIERSVAKRKDKVYIDFLQNHKGQTMTAPYSVRPKPGAPVSTPLEWWEVNEKLDPASFTIFTIHDRLEKTGDLWKPVLGKGENIMKAFPKLEKMSQS